VVVQVGGLNQITVGQQAVVKTYATARIVGGMIGGEWPLSVNIDCLAQTPEEAMDMVDLVFGVMAVGREDFYYHDGIQVRHMGFRGEADIPEDKAEEIYGHGLSVDLAVEWRVFQAASILKGWKLQLSVMPADAHFPPYDLASGS